MIEIAAWFEGAQNVLFVHAHPDDETIATGGTIAGLAAAGRAPLLVTLTRGERGEVVPGTFAGAEGSPELSAHRESELAAAVAALGVAQHAYLGTPPARATGLEPRVYEDSGMQWADPDADGVRWAVAAPDASEAALTRSPAVEALNDLIALAVAWGAGAIASYDERGGYGHPDHVFAHRAARAVARGLELPFWQVEAVGADPARSTGIDRGTDPGTDPGDDRWTDHGGDTGDDRGIDPEGAGVDAPLRHITQDHDVAPWLDRKLAALRAHATQLTIDGSDIVHVGGQREPIGLVERFRRLE